MSLFHYKKETFAANSLVFIPDHLVPPNRVIYALIGAAFLDPFSVWLFKAGIFWRLAGDSHKLDWFT